MATAFIEGAPMNTAKITEALTKLQAALPNVTLDGDNPHFKSKFMTLGNLSSTLLPKLSEHGLAYAVQSEVNDKGVKVISTLLHRSGEYLTAEFQITETQPQKVGSAVTYYRRYGLAMLTGVVADADDDGNESVRQEPEALRKAQNKPADKPKQGMDKLQSPFRKKVTSEWIGKKITKEEAIALADKVKTETGLEGDAMYEEVLKRLEAGDK